MLLPVCACHHDALQTACCHRVVGTMSVRVNGRQCRTSFIARDSVERTRGTLRSCLCLNAYAAESAGVSASAM